MGEGRPQAARARDAAPGRAAPARGRCWRRPPPGSSPRPTPPPSRTPIPAAWPCTGSTAREYANAIRDLLDLDARPEDAPRQRRTRSTELREPGQRAVGVAGAARQLLVGGLPREPAGDGGSRHAAGRRHLHRADEPGAGRSRRRRPAVRLAGRRVRHAPLPGRRRIRVRGDAAAPALSLHHRHGRAAPAGRSRRRRARGAVLGGRRGQGAHRARKLQPATRRAIRSGRSTCTRPTSTCASGCRSPPAAIRSACRSSAAIASPRASCSRRSAASPAPPTSCITATPRWTTCRSPARCCAGQRPARSRSLRAVAQADSPSRRRVFICRPATSPAGGADAPAASCRRWPPGPTAARSPQADLDVLLDFYRAGRAAGGFEAGIERGLERILAAPSFLFRVVTPPASAGRTLSAERPRSGLAALVLPLEQHPRRRAAGAKRPPAGCARPRRCAGRRGGCWPIRARRRSWTASRCSG